jgi:N-acetylmuramic acid 6-phosphate etherase
MQGMSRPPEDRAEPREGETRLTEQRNPASADIDRLPPLGIVQVINAEDRRVPEAVGAVLEDVARAVQLAEEALRAGGRLIYVGAGTSGRLGVLDASEMPPTFGTDPELVQGIIAGGYDALLRAREGAEDLPEGGAAAVDERGVGPKDFVVGIATSGTTPFVHGALARARELGARTGFLLCTPPPEELVRTHDVVIAPLVGPEVVTGSTRMKAGTATKLVLNMISTGAMIRLGKVYGNLMVDLQATCIKLQDRGERILGDTLGVEREEARELMRRSGGNVKTAIAMYAARAEPEEAVRLLADVGGRLGEILQRNVDGNG